MQIRRWRGGTTVRHRLLGLRGGWRRRRIARGAASCCRAHLLFQRDPDHPYLAPQSSVQRSGSSFRRARQLPPVPRGADARQDDLQPPGRRGGRRHGPPVCAADPRRSRSCHVHPPAGAANCSTPTTRRSAACVGDAEFEVLRSVSELLVPSHTGGGGQFFALRGRRVRDRADLRLTAGELSCERLLAGARTKRWWMGPAFGAGAADLPAETQFCLVRLAEDAYAVLLPLVSGHHRCTLRAARSGSKEGVDLDVASGDPSARTGEALDNALYVAAGAGPFALLDDAFAAVSERLGTFDVARRKQTPADLDWFGWCTWDAFYQAVDPKGVTAGLRFPRRRRHARACPDPRRRLADRRRRQDAEPQRRQRREQRRRRRGGGAAGGMRDRRLVRAVHRRRVGRAPEAPPSRRRRRRRRRRRDGPPAAATPLALTPPSPPSPAERAAAGGGGRRLAGGGGGLAVQQPHRRRRQGHIARAAVAPRVHLAAAAPLSDAAVLQREHAGARCTAASPRQLFGSQFGAQLGAPL